MMFDLMNRVDVKRAISPVSVADNTAQVSQVLDVRNYSAAALLIATGSIADADATFAVLLEESNTSGSGYTTVAAGDLIGTAALAGFTFADDDKARKIGYRGSKRYIRATITPANNASAAVISALWIGTPLDAPAANPPV